MKLFVFTAALALCLSAHASSTASPVAHNSKTETAPSLKQHDKKGALVTQTGSAMHNVTVTTTVDPKLMAQSPYSQAQIVVSKQINGVEQVVGSKIVSVTDRAPARYSDTVEYVSECVKTEEKNDSNCATDSTPVGMLANVYYTGENAGTPTYKVNVGWRELVALNAFEKDGMTIFTPTISERSFMQNVKYSKPVELSGAVSSKDGQRKDNVVVRVTLM